jgi:hypothetical protein
MGLDVVDFLLEPGSDADDPYLAPEDRYHWGDLVHGSIPKRYVELPQICTRAARDRPLDHEVVEAPGGSWAAIRLRYRYQRATRGRRPGSLWEQTLLFLPDTRYFLSGDRITPVNDVEALILRTDLPGHLRLSGHDGWEALYLSYVDGAGEPGPDGQGSIIPAGEFRPEAPFPPEERFWYRRRDDAIPQRMIRAYRVRLPDGRPGPWLAGITLAPVAVYEAWCHVRPAGAPYVCLIQEIGGRSVRAGESFGAAYAIGWFDTLDAAAAVADRYAGTTALDVSPGTWLPVQGGGIGSPILKEHP